MMKRFGLWTVLVSISLLAGCATKGDFRHVVLFKFKDDAPAADVAAIEKQIMDMKGKISTIKAIEWGKDCSVEGLQGGFTHSFLVTFKNPEGLDVYLPHPAHKKVVEALGPIKEKVLVLDYFAGEAIPPMAPIETKGKLRHVVMFQFKEGTTPEQVTAIENKFRSLPASIPEIKAFEYGTAVVGERKMNDGLTHCFLVTFDNAAGREIYLPHPAHKEFVALVGPSVEKVRVIDYIAID